VFSVVFCPFLRVALRQFASERLRGGFCLYLDPCFPPNSLQYCYAFRLLGGYFFLCFTHVRGGRMRRREK